MKMGNSNSIQNVTRTVHIGQPDCVQFPNNTIISSKYTLWSFLPKNLYEQFRRFANICFVIVTLFSLFNDGPVSPVVYVIPIIFLMGTTAIKQGYEDYCRHRADNAANMSPVSVLRKGCLMSISSKEVRVGDIVRLTSDEDVPCDMALLVSSQLDKKCFVTTANLDGETNLKVMECPTSLNIKEDDLDNISGVIVCEYTSPNLYKFSGYIHLDETTEVYYQNGRLNEGFEGTENIVKFNNQSEECTCTQSVCKELTQKAPLAAENVLLRGSRLKNTSYVYGCAVYTGQQTKVALNSRLSRNKFSTVERTINWFLGFFFCLLILEACLSTTCEWIGTTKISFFFYLGPPRQLKIFKNLFNYIILYYYIIPTSMYFTIELQRFLGTLFFESDLEMYIEEKRAACNTSDLNEELGQIQYVFTDKTGTLTENEMEFQRCSVNGKMYFEEDGKLFLLPENGNLQEGELVPSKFWTEDLDRFFLALALCHTVQCDFQSNPARYQASSTDEKAFVEVSERCGIQYLGTVNDTMKVNMRGEIRLFKKLEVLEFTSERKRMSVLLSDEESGTIWLYCKGAESSLIPLLAGGFTDEANRHIDDFSTRGLRTLIFGCCQISMNHYLEGKRKILEARNTLDQETKEKLLESAFLNFENNLQMLGITAVEDQLQEYVSETLASLYSAGIKVWVLTGDKVETAKSIAYSCGHFKRGTDLINLTEFTCVDSCLSSLDYYRKKVNDERYRQYGLVLDGPTFTIILKQNPEVFVEIAMVCTAAICCRLSPKQKAQIVSLVKHTKKNPITLAIGDGANDISMIQEAHVGIGIMGKEGQQASNCSDFAFAQFYFLARALLIHGHWYYLRAANLILYFFYKNIVFITPQVYFAFGLSPQVLYCSLFLLLYNTLFTTAPIIVYGLTEQDFRPKTLTSYPELYKSYENNRLMTWRNFITWILFGFWHSVVIYYVPYYTVFNDSDVDLATFGTAILHLVVFVVNLKMLLFSQYWTLLLLGSIIGSIASFVAFTVYYSLSFRVIESFDLDIGFMFGILTHLYGEFWFWELSLLCVTLCLLPDVFYETLERSGIGFDILKPRILTSHRSFNVPINV